VNISLILGMDYSPKLSISITYIFLVGSSLALLWKNATKKNEVTNRSNMNPDLVLLTLPIMSSGTIFGVIHH
jgi:hypothetical protein